jgi:hypothetical protein
MDIRPADWIAWVSWSPGFLARRIQEFQRHLGFVEPASRATHAEVVLWVTDAEVCTFSQTFPKAKMVIYGRPDFDKMFEGDKPSRYLFRINNYGGIVNAKFINAMSNKMAEITKRKPSDWAKFVGKFGINYDILQLPNYWINDWFGDGKKHINWLEIPGGVGVCSDKASECLDAGFCAVLGQSPIFPTRPNSEVTPAHIWSDAWFTRISA